MCGKEAGDVRVRSGVTRLTGLGTTAVAELVWLSAEHNRECCALKDFISGGRIEVPRGDWESK